MKRQKHHSAICLFGYLCERDLLVNCRDAKSKFRAEACKHAHRLFEKYRATFLQASKQTNKQTIGLNNFKRKQILNTTTQYQQTQYTQYTQYNNAHNTTIQQYNTHKHAISKQQMQLFDSQLPKIANSTHGFFCLSSRLMPSSIEPKSRIIFIAL